MSQYFNLDELTDFYQDIYDFQAEQDKQKNLARAEDIQKQGELFESVSSIKSSETLERILEDPSIEVNTSNGDSEEIVRGEIDMILFNIENSDSEFEKARLYKELNNRLTMV